MRLPSTANCRPIYAHKITTLSVVLLLILGFAQHATAEFNPDYGKIHDYLNDLIREARVPGAALAVVEKGRIVHFQGFGKAGPDSRAVTPQTPFGIGSVSKSFGALAAMQLVEKGLLDLDAPVQQYLPDFRTADVEASKKILVRHLIYHQSGLSKYVHFADWRTRHDPNKALNRAVDFLQREKLKTPPGQTFGYSDPGYVVLAAVVQAVANKPFTQVVRDEIFVPLGMENSFAAEVEAREDGAAKGYRYWFGSPLPHRGLSWCYFDPLAAGGLYCSAEDLATYLITHLNGDRIGSIKILSETGIKELHRPEVKIKKGTHYAMGWLVFEDWIEDSQVIWHGGLTPKYLAHAVMLPEHDLGFVLLFNVSNPRLMQCHKSIIRMLLGMSPLESENSSGWTGIIQRSMCGAMTVIILLSILSGCIFGRRLKQLPEGKWPLRGPWLWTRRIISLVICFAGLAAFITAYCLLGGQFYAMLDYVPDLGHMIVAAGFLALIGMILQIYLIMRVCALRRQAPS